MASAASAVSTYTPSAALRTKEEELVLAISHNDLGLVKLWVERGASLTALDAHGNMPLHIAVIVKSNEIVEYLLERGADPQARNREGKTPLVLAKEMDQQALVLLLTREASAPVSATGYTKDEVDLRSRLLASASEEDHFTSHVLKLKGALKERVTLASTFKPLLKQLRQPWELLQTTASPGNFFQNLFSKDPLKNPKLLQTDVFFTPLLERIKRITESLKKLESLNHKNNQDIADSLQAIQGIYQRFIGEVCKSSLEDRPHLLKGRVQLRGIGIGCRFLSPEAVQALNTKSDEFGIHHVALFQGIHWKVNPYAPGIERSVDHLNKLISGQGSPPTSLVKIDNTPFLASKTIEGTNLQKVLWENPEKVKHIANFSSMVVLGILTDPIDGKPDNFILHENTIISIDNDMAFSNGICQFYDRKTDQNLHVVDVKYVLFCFPQMDDPVDPAFRKAFLELRPEEILLQWLRGISDQNSAYKQLRVQKLFTAEEFERLQLPIAISPSKGSPGLIETLFTKLIAMQECLKANPNATHWDIFYAGHPILARYYRHELDDYRTTTATPNINDAYLHLYRREAPPVEKAVNMRSVIHSRLTVKSALEKHKQTEGQHEISRTQSPKRALENFITTLDWTKIAPEMQNKLLNELFTVPFLRHVSLQGCSELKDKLLMRLAQNCKKLESLTLIRCPQITGAGISALLTKNPHLQVTVSECTSLYKDYLFLARSCPHFTVRLRTGEIVSPRFTDNPLALHQAIHANDEGIFFAWLAQGAPVDAQDEHGSYPLHCAVRLAEHDPQKAKLFISALLFCGASPDAKEHAGETPTEIATKKKLSEIESLLKELEHPVARLLHGDQIRNYWPDAEHFLTARKKLVPNAYSKARWAKTFEDVSYLETSRFKPERGNRPDETLEGFLYTYFSQLKRLWIWGEDQPITWTCLLRLRDQLNVEEVYVDSEQAKMLSAEKIESIEDLAKLKAMKLTGGVQFALSLQNKEIDDLRANGIEAEGGKALAAVLPGLPITNLNLIGKRIGFEGVRALKAVAATTGFHLML